MYINRKTGELVEAEFVDMSGFIRNQWEIFHSNGSREYITDGEFQKKYGEAMICPNVGMCKCFHKEPHIKHYRCKSEHRIKACGECIPYIPEEYDVDNEPVFPICGTCNARKSNLSWLMLTPEQLNKVVWRYTDKEKQTYALGTIIKEIAKAQINHLAKPEFGIFKLIDGEFIRFEHYLKENEK